MRHEARAPMYMVSGALARLGLAWNGILTWGHRDTAAKGACNKKSLFTILKATPDLLPTPACI